MTNLPNGRICDEIIIPLICKLVAIKNDLLKGNEIDHSLLDHITELKKYIDGRGNHSTVDTKQNTHNFLDGWESDDDSSVNTDNDKCYDINDLTIKKMLEISEEQLSKATIDWEFRINKMVEVN